MIKIFRPDLFSGKTWAHGATSVKPGLLFRSTVMASPSAPSPSRAGHQTEVTAGHVSQAMMHALGAASVWPRKIPPQYRQPGGYHEKGRSGHHHQRESNRQHCAARHGDHETLDRFHGRHGDTMSSRRSLEERFGDAGAAMLSTEFNPPNGLVIVSLACGSGLHAPSTTRRYS